MCAWWHQYCNFPPLKFIQEHQGTVLESVKRFFPPLGQRLSPVTWMSEVAWLTSFFVRSSIHSCYTCFISPQQRVFVCICESVCFLPRSFIFFYTFIHKDAHTHQGFSWLKMRRRWYHPVSLAFNWLKQRILGVLIII